MRKRAACGTAAAFCLAALLFSIRPAFAQGKPTAAPLQIPEIMDAPIEAVVTASDALMLGPVQMIAPAQTRSVFLNPRGRYALIVQNEAALPPGPLLNKRETGATALLLYDARLNKVKTLWQRRADGGRHSIAPFGAAWLPETDCAVVVATDSTVPLDPTARGISTHALLLFDVSKTLVAKTLMSSTSAGISLIISPTKPVFVYQEMAGGKSVRQTWLGSARSGLGTPITVSSNTFFMGWNAAGTAANGFTIVTSPPATPDAKPKMEQRWFEWDGRSPKLTELSAQPAQAALVQELPPPELPFVLKTETVSLSPRAKSAALTLNTLYLEAIEATDVPNHSVLIAPNADHSYLLVDKSAVLYEAKGALYAVPLVQMKRDVFLAAQNEAYKQAALRNAPQIASVIFQYARVNDGMFPAQSDFAGAASLFALNPELLKGFTYVPPGGTQASLTNAGQTVMGYIATPAGRAVLYADRHVNWEPAR